jgi:hypothetical protein
MRNLLWCLLCLVSVSSQASTPPQFKKVLVIVLENTDYAVALKQPFLSSLIKHGAVFSNFLATSHPSLPNYVAMIAGDPMGIKDDGNVSLKGQHLGNLLEKKRLSWKNYAEDYPGNCFLGRHEGKYARKHVPFLQFENILNFPQECAQVVNAKQFKIDAESGNLPTYSMYSPNLDNDGHDTDPQTADRWLAKEFGPRFSDPKFMKDLLVVVTFDESLQYNAPNQILTLFLGSNVIPGSEVTAQTNSYDVLKTIEDVYDLGNLGRGDAQGKAITGIWK